VTSADPRRPGVRRLPAEWEPQRAVLLTWPHQDTDWAPRLAEVERLYVALAGLIARRQGLLLVCRDRPQHAYVEETLRSNGVPLDAVRLAIAPSNDTWARDHGPITVLDERERPRVIDFRFNGWGGKFASELDDAITGELLKSGTLDDTAWESSPLVLEGGAIESDGLGTLLAVRRTIDDPLRNPGWSLARIQQELQDRLGVRRVLWLDHGQLAGDDTDGHIDTLARFCSPRAICHATAHPRANAAEAASLKAMIEELRTLRDARGRPYRLVALPAPAPCFDEDGEPLPAGYVNFLLINGTLLLPTYDDPADDLAAEILAAEFPGRDIERLDCRPLIRQGGSLHCISMQLPAAAPTDAP
jgi:agmatine/peptidylarginine deiminase